MKRMMMMLSLALLAGCTSAEKLREAEKRGFDRAMREAVRERYWEIQRQQQHVPALGTLRS